MLVRSRDALAVVDVNNEPNPEILAMVPRHISHTSELRLRSISLLHSKRVREICRLEAPELEHFELEISDISPVRFHRIAGTTLFNGRAPKLRTLALSQVSIPWSLIPRGQLTQLNITLFKRRFTAGLSSPDDLHQLIDLLINSPQLEVLVLEFCLPKIPSQVSDELPIHLPRLSRLGLSGPTSRVTNLLKRLKLPSSAALRLRCIFDPPTEDALLILPLISAHFHHPVPVEFKSLRVTANWMKSHIEVAASISPPKPTTSYSSVFECDADNEPELFLSFIGLNDFSLMNQTDILGQVCSILPVSNVEFLSISAPMDNPFVNWHGLFQYCTEVTTIHVRGHGTRDLLLYLAPNLANTPSGRKGTKGKSKHDNKVSWATTLFPKLTSLLLQDLDFDIAVPYSGVLYDVLVNALRWRETNMSLVKTLTIDSCVITTIQANSLKKHVREFSWYGDKCPLDLHEWEACDCDNTTDFADLGALPEDFSSSMPTESWW
jgi:hypothetical protein